MALGQQALSWFGEGFVTGTGRGQLFQGGLWLYVEFLIALANQTAKGKGPKLFINTVIIRVETL